MKKLTLVMMAVILSPPLFIYGWFALTSGEHQYAETDILSFWLYTPTELKDTPKISDIALYDYEYDPDNEQTSVIIHWTNIRDIAEQKKLLYNFVQQLADYKKDNCGWKYNNKDDYSDDYKRYCISQKGNTLELQFFETVH
jgi:hypothetical protein